MLSIIIPFTVLNLSRLLQTHPHESALQILQEECIYLTNLGQLQESNLAANAGLAFLDYLFKTWMPVPLWASWSQYGRIQASRILQVSIEGVIPTTNHLEAFNGILKRKHIHRWQRAGKRLRLDILVFLLVRKILPGIFQQ